MIGVKHFIDKQAIRHTVRTLAKIDRHVARKALRTGVAKAGQYVLGEEKNEAPKGKTGLFRRTLAKRERSYGQGTRAVSVVGQRYQKHFGSKTKDVARRRNHGLSTGLSGTGVVVPIHLVEERNRPHVIKPRLARSLAYIPRTVRTAKGGLRTGRIRDIVFSRKVHHPGTPGSKFVAKVRRRSRVPAQRIIRQHVASELRRVRGY